jgi:(p)ppGpp synthase/HD superfamily hydrolase
MRWKRATSALSPTSSCSSPGSFADRGVSAEVSGRRKRAYSIWRKMERKSVGFEQLSDIVGFRVVVKSLAECYQALGVVHTTWPVVPGRFKDYISTPKQNDYRSIHTTVIGPGKQRVELQIRTREMHEIAEYGIAAHALYKDGVGSPTEMLSRESSAYAWLRRTIELLAEGSNPEEFLEHTKLELFHDQVFCFTPKGKLIALPRHANAIDFAYAVHTDVGNTAVGCKINGKIAPLVNELMNGDEVEIIVSKAQSAPPAAWESLVTTGKARASIRRATGRRCAANMRAWPSDHRAAVPARQDRLFRREAAGCAAATGAHLDRRGDVCGRAGRDAGRRRRARHVSRLQGGARRRDREGPKAESGWHGPQACQGGQVQVPAGNGPAIPIRGINSDLPVRFAPDGGAVPGDRIVGILTPGEGITIYPIQSPSLKDFEDQPEHWLDLRWDIDELTPQRFPARITLRPSTSPVRLRRSRR